MALRRGLASAGVGPGDDYRAGGVLDGAAGDRPGCLSPRGAASCVGEEGEASGLGLRRGGHGRDVQDAGSSTEFWRSLFRALMLLSGARSRDFLVDKANGAI